MRGPLAAIGEAAFRGIVAARSKLYDARILATTRVSKPVISVGNLTVGGNGKTPLVLWLVRRLSDRGLHVAVVSRGYRASQQRPGVTVVSVKLDETYDCGPVFDFGHTATLVRMGERAAAAALAAPLLSAG